MYEKLITIGVHKQHPEEFSDKIKTINKFCLMCIIYVLAYIFYSAYSEFYVSSAVFIITFFLFASNFYFNHKKKYELSKLFIIIAINCSSFYMSVFYGFFSGFYIYFFTNPLIIFALFGFYEVRKIIVIIALSLSTIFVLYTIDHFGHFYSATVSQATAKMLYSVNTLLAYTVCLFIVGSFVFNNKKINQILTIKNADLLNNQKLLEEKIEEKTETENKLQQSIRDVEILLSETHHRVKNNLAIISGMLDLQMLSTANEEILYVLGNSRNRIKSMSLIHESLYQHDNLSQIEFSRYLTTLTEEIKNTYPSISSNIELNRFFEVAFLEITTAIPCGLLVNEVLSNAYKHAFLGKTNGKIEMVFKKEQEFFTLEIKDDGVGMNNDLPSVNQTSLGLTLIEAFSKQLKGKYEFVSGQGTTFVIKFKA